MNDQAYRRFSVECIFYFTLFLSLSGCGPKNADRPAEADPGIQPRALRLSNLDGVPVDLGKFRGNTLFINFWATWCKPCLQEMPAIRLMMEKMKDEPVVFLFASEEASGEIESFRQKYPYPFRYVRIDNAAEMNIAALPTTFIFDASGTLRFNEMGYRNWNSPDNLELLTEIIRQK